MQDGRLKKGFMRLTGALDRRFGWDHLPKPVALVTLVGLRMTLRRHNLFDTSGTTVGWGPELPHLGLVPLCGRRTGRAPTPSIPIWVR